jgi:parvulin-like peptidyl-prolyl isomerase
MILATATLVLAAQTPTTDAPKETAAAAAAAPAAKTKVAKTARNAKPAPKKPAADVVLAKVGNESILQSSFDLYMDMTLNDQQRLQLAFVPGAKDRYLDQFLQFKVLAAKARQDGLQKQPDHARKLALMDMQLLIQELMEKDGPALQAKLTVSDAEVKAYFDKHPDKFKTPEMFTARHILVGVKSEDNAKGLTDDEAKAKVAKIQAELKAGKSFAEEAKAYSDDPGSKDNGGLYEDTAFGKFMPEFEKAVRAQEIGKVGEPVKTDYGYHLILVEKITPAAAQTFEAAKEAAKEQATAERQEEVMKTYLDAAKKEMGFKLMPPPPAPKPAATPAPEPAAATPAPEPAAATPAPEPTDAKTQQEPQ